MLTDISNDANFYNNNTHTHQLKPLKIAKRTNKKVLNVNTKLTSTFNIEKIPPYAQHKPKYTKKKDINELDDPMKMIDEPNYRFSKIYSNPKDIINPFYEYTQLGPITPDIDLTSNISFFKNIVKKYNKPLNISYTEQLSYTVSQNGKIIKPHSQIDPVLQCFKHQARDKHLKFGDYLITVEQDGVARMELEPKSKANPKYVDDNVDEEELYKSDEGETSRLENSDLDFSEDESDMDIELDINVDSPLISSPIKKQTSPEKQFEGNNIFRTMKNNASPIKSLQQKRTGVVNKPVKKFNYAKFDNSMTVSAKAIMKMVDDSLVSSDTELYNNSLSFMKNTHTTGSKNIFNLNINEDDLMSAMSLNDIEVPFISKFKDLKL